MRNAILITAVTVLLTTTAQAAPPSPEEFLGHPLGADLQLATYDQVLRYLKGVAAEADRVSIEAAGQSTLDNEMVTVVLTSAANQQNLDRYRDIARQLANPDRLSAEETAQLTAEGKVIALVTCTIHSTEVGSTQMAMEFVYDFATTQDPAKLAWMEDVIVLLMPSINPDGQVMVVDWYNEYLGTDYEGGRMPWLYHHYVGHDNNRDFYQLTQKETRAVNNRALSPLVSPDLPRRAPDGQHRSQDVRAAPNRPPGPRDPLPDLSRDGSHRHQHELPTRREPARRVSGTT